MYVLCGIFRTRVLYNTQTYAHTYTHVFANVRGTRRGITFGTTADERSPVMLYITITKLYTSRKMLLPKTHGNINIVFIHGTLPEHGFSRLRFKNLRTLHSSRCSFSAALTYYFYRVIPISYYLSFVNICIAHVMILIVAHSTPCLSLIVMFI